MNHDGLDRPLEDDDIPDLHFAGSVCTILTTSRPVSLRTRLSG